MRTMVVSPVSAELLNHSIIGRAVQFKRMLVDQSYEIMVDDDMGYAIDCLCGDPDQAIQLLCAPEKLQYDLAHCHRCGSELDDDWCWVCSTLVR